MIVVCIILILIIIVCIGAGVYMYVNASKDEAKAAMRNIVDEMNKSTFYTYTFGKEHGQGLQSLDVGFQEMNNKLDRVTRDVDQLYVDAATKNELRVVSENEKFKRLQVGNHIFAPKEIGESNVWLGISSSNSDPEMNTGLDVDLLRVNSNVALLGDVIIANGIKTNFMVGSLIESKNEKTGERYGIGSFTNGITRLYSSGATRLSKANGDGTFQDLLHADTSKIQVSKPFCLNDQVCLVASGAQIMACPASNPVATDVNCKKVV